ncbi:hypothetical protein BT63DRAFT_457917 [Microthyrium microscopicum]|uniref:Uncharacterized protein n=1 Tax=Microthyrium microscopicum TaxID=703497 RepID=A0A6A6U3T8_9PEZI|nr:hypothetical protein BT63DRAFT_457917 [Microthyrium microscopicum]
MAPKQSPRKQPQRAAKQKAAAKKAAPAPSPTTTRVTKKRYAKKPATVKNTFDRAVNAAFRKVKAEENKLAAAQEEYTKLVNGAAKTGSTASGSRKSIRVVKAKQAATNKLTELSNKLKTLKKSVAAAEAQLAKAHKNGAGLATYMATSSPMSSPKRRTTPSIDSSLPGSAPVTPTPAAKSRKSKKDYISISGLPSPRDTPPKYYHRVTNTPLGARPRPLSRSSGGRSTPSPLGY